MDYQGKDDSASTLAKLADSVAEYYGMHQQETHTDAVDDNAAIHRVQLNPEQKYLRGFFLSEAMCGEVALQLLPDLGAIYSNNPVRGALLNQETRFLRENSVIDCAHSGSSATARCSLLTSVRRNRRMESEAYNRSVAVIMADWYGAAGCTEEHLADLAGSVRRCLETASSDGRHIAVGVIISSGEGSPVSRERAASELTDAGADIFFSADEAAVYVREIISSAGGRN